MESELQHLQIVFQANGFPKDAVKKKLSRQPHPTSHPSEPTGEDPLWIMCLPYVQILSEKLERVCTPLEVKAVFKPARTLRQTVMQVKTRIPEERKREVVYKVPCKNAIKPTSGRPRGHSRWESVSTSRRWIVETQRTASQSMPMNQTTQFYWDGARVKRSSMTGYWQRRTIAAIHIKLSEKTMNLDGGLQLPTVWKPVLKPPWPTFGLSRMCPSRPMPPLTPWLLLILSIFIIPLYYYSRPVACHLIKHSRPSYGGCIY